MTASSAPPSQRAVAAGVGKSVFVIGAPFSHGQTQRGVDFAPQALRTAGLGNVFAKLGWQMKDSGDIDFSTSSHKSDCATTPSTVHTNDIHQTARPVKEETYDESELPNASLIGQGCEKIFNAVKEAVKTKKVVLTLGGDHSIAAATIAGMLTEYPDLCVVWVDAHGDINTPESSHSKLYHGMPVAHLLGWFAKRVPGFGWMEQVPLLPEERLAFIGLRDIDVEERALLKNSKVNAFTMQHIDRLGICQVFETALSLIDPNSERPIHLSFDIDACDPSVASGTGTRSRGGLTYREAHFICEALAETGRVVSMDLVEINPDLDVKDVFLHGDDPAIAADATQTVRLGLELIASVGGKTIL